MENWKIQSSVLLIIGSVVGFVSMLGPEYAYLVIVAGFIGLFIIWSWPEYEYRKEIYNPANEPEKLHWWEKFEEVFLKMGWKVRKVRRRKR